MAGILKVNDANQISEAWKLYSRFAWRADEDIPELLTFRSKYCPDLCISIGERDWRQKNVPDSNAETPILRIRYCGVWDTVGTLGIKAVTATFDRSTDKRYSRHDTELSATVEAARHAVSIDERRVHFMPTLWRNVRKLNDEAGKSSYDEDAPFQQKWFAGDHGSVGGGGPDRRLSNAALHWVLKGAIDNGLKVRLDGRSQLRDIRYDARGPLRNTPDEGVTEGNAGRLAISRAMASLKSALFSAWRAGPAEISDVHSSALRRWFVVGPELPEGRDYRPKSLLRLRKSIEALRPVYQAADGLPQAAIDRTSLRRVIRSLGSRRMRRVARAKRARSSISTGT